MNPLFAYPGLAGEPGPEDVGEERWDSDDDPITEEAPLIKSSFETGPGQKHFIERLITETTR